MMNSIQFKGVHFLNRNKLSDNDFKELNRIILNNPELKLSQENRGDILIIDSGDRQVQKIDFDLSLFARQVFSRVTSTDSLHLPEIVVDSDGRKVNQTHKNMDEEQAKLYSEGVIPPSVLETLRTGNAKNKASQNSAKESERTLYKLAQKFPFKLFRSILNVIQENIKAVRQKENFNRPYIYLTALPGFSYNTIGYSLNNEEKQHFVNRLAADGQNLAGR